LGTHGKRHAPCSGAAGVARFSGAPQVLDLYSNQTRSSSMRQFHKAVSLGTAIVAATTLVGCGGGDADEELVGSAEVAISAPDPLVLSALLRFTGAVRSVSRCVPVDGQPTALRGLPTGSAVLAEGEAFPTADCSGEASWIADPQTVAIAPGVSTRLRYVFRPNGVIVIDDDWVPDSACSSGNLALNAAGSGYPSATASSMWGGGQQPWQLLDGQTEYPNWASGVALTFGGAQFIEVDLGSPTAFDQLVVWHHHDMTAVGHNVPQAVSISYFDGATWQTVPGFSRTYDLGYLPQVSSNAHSIPDRYDFAPVTGSKVRWQYDGSASSVLGYASGWHGWSYEVELFSSACP
jgi:hypothetical protein